MSDWRSIGLWIVAVCIRNFFLICNVMCFIYIALYSVLLEICLHFFIFFFTVYNIFSLFRIGISLINMYRFKFHHCKFELYPTLLKTLRIKPNTFLLTSQFFSPDSSPLGVQHHSSILLILLLLLLPIPS